MRRFWGWLRKVNREIDKAKLNNLAFASLLLSIRDLEETRKIKHLNRLIRLLYENGMHHLCPTPEEIEEWIKSGEIEP